MYVCICMYMPEYLGAEADIDVNSSMYSGQQWCGRATTKWDNFKKHFTTVRI